MKKKVFIVVVTIILVLIISAMIFAPPVARNYINKNGNELIGRNISIEKIRLNYFTSTLRIIGFKLFEKNDTTVFTGFDTLLVDLQPLRLIKSELVVKRLWLINPVSQITKRDTVFNFSDIVDFFSSSDTTAVQDTSTAKSDYKFEFSDIKLREGRIRYTDDDIKSTTLLNNLSFTIPYLSWNQKESSKAGLTFNFRNGGYFTANGSFNPGSGDFNSTLVINNLDISEFAAYIKQYASLNTIEGLAGCNLNISGNSELLDSISLNGRFSIDSFIATDGKDRKILGAEGLNIALNNSMPIAGKFVFDSIELAKPYLLFEMKDSSNNFIELLPPEQPDTVTNMKADTLSEPFVYFVNSFTISNGIIDFKDNSLDEPFKYHLSQIKLNADSISSLSSWLTVYSSMKLNEQGDLKAEIGINPSDPYELKVDYVISNFQLTDFSPYSKFYVGSSIVYGKMFYTGKTSITARQITSENKLIIRNAQLGKKSGGIFNIPLRLALYLIKDMNGDIRIDLPLSGDLNDPDIKIGRLIWTTFKNFIIKIAASPFIALSNLFGIDQKDIQQIDFTYADTLLSDANKKKLDQLVMIRDKKPELNIELTYFNDRIKEKEQIGLEEAGRIFRKQTGNNYATEREKFEIFLRDTLAKDTIDLYNDCIKLAGKGRIDSISKYRDSLRISMIENYLKLKDSSSGIQLLIPHLEAVKNVGSHPVFEVKFFMEE
jgi:hypothetical protein